MSRSRAPEAAPFIKPLGIVVGLKAEARLLRGLDCRVATGGGTAAGASGAADRLAPDARALVSFGLAGGLDPALAPGTILIPTQVIEGLEAWMTDPGLNGALGGPTPHRLIGGGSIIASAAEKQAAFAETGAHAIDLESAAVARAAARHRLPFAVLRAVADPAHRPLPHAAMVALDQRGRIALVRVILATLRHPAELPALLALAGDAARARRALLGRLRAAPGLHPRP